MRPSQRGNLLLVLGAVLTFVVLVLAMVKWGPHLARDYLASQIGSAIGREVTIGAIEISPLRAQVRVEDLVVAGAGAAEAPFLTLPEFNATIDVSEALSGRLHILDAHLSSPHVRAVRLEQSRFSFQDMLDHLSRPPARARDPFGFVMEKLAIKHGFLSLQDQTSARELHLADVHASVSGLSTRRDDGNQRIEATASFSFAGGTGNLALQGVPFGKQPRLHGRFKAAKMSLVTIAPYLQFPAPLTLTDGALALDIQVAYGVEVSSVSPAAVASPAHSVQGTATDHGPVASRPGILMASAVGPPPASSTWSLTGGSLLVTQAILAAGEEQVATLQQLSVVGIRMNLGSRHVRADVIRLADSSLKVTRRKNGRLLIEQWLSASDVEDRTNPEWSAPEVGQNGTAAAAAGAEPSWQYSLGALEVANLKVRFIDLSVPVESRLPSATMNVRTENVSSDLAAMVPLKASLTLDGGSQAWFDGLLSPRPIKIDARVASSGFDLTHLEPYFGRFVNLDLVSGTLSGDGKLELITDTALIPARVGYTGKLSVKDVKAVDQVLKTDFLRWGAVEVPSINVDWEPALHGQSRVEIGDMSVTDLFGRVILDENGELNLKHVVRLNEAPADVPTLAAAERFRTLHQPQSGQADAGGRPEVSLGMLRITSGHLNFTDNFVNPNYAADLTQLSGSIAGVSSRQPDPAEVAINGFVNGNAPLEISGQMNLLAPQPLLDLKATARGIELTQLTPYAIRWAGYTIESGTMSADVRYRVEGTELDAENRLVLHQVRLGEKVKSESASNLPLQLTLSILRDRRGNVTLNLPIKGSLSDPEFSLPGLAGQAIGGLIRKAATAPFTLLASLGSLSADTAGSDPLNVIEFSPGRTEISDRQRNRLKILSQVLKERPEVDLEVIGYAGRSADLEALRIELNREVITDADLLILARRRGDTLRDALVEAGVAAGRLRLLAPRFAAGGGDLPPSRAELKIQVPDQSNMQDVG